MGCGNLCVINYHVCCPMCCNASCYCYQDLLFASHLNFELPATYVQSYIIYVLCHVLSTTTCLFAATTTCLFAVVNVFLIAQNCFLIKCYGYEMRSCKETN